MELFEKLNEDVRFRQGLKACMNCGICTAICPAAEFFDYDPRMLVTTIETRDNEEIEGILKSDVIWYCGQCMSCKTRCPRGNVPGMVVGALRKLSQELGYFVYSRMGRQQYAIASTVGKNILDSGYCVHPERLEPSLHPEQGPVWEWIVKNREKVYERLGSNFDKAGPGGLRKISAKTLEELRSIFKVTGGTALLETIKSKSRDIARDNGYPVGDEPGKDYFMDVYNGSDKINKI